MSTEIDYKTYTFNVRSRFILTQTALKQALGPGYQVTSVAVATDISTLPVINVDSAAMAIINTGFRALARAYHPDLGGDPEVMVILNRTKKELTELLNSLKETN
jgi:hypothetical protein